MHLRAVFQKIRPDFDLGSPGLKEAWERGDRDQFLVDTLVEPIRYTDGKSIGIKRCPPQWGGRLSAVRVYDDVESPVVRGLGGKGPAMDPLTAHRPRTLG